MKTIRETSAVALMGVPLVTTIVSAAVLLPAAPAELAIHFDRSGVVDGTAPTWLLVAISLVLSLGALGLAIVGLRPSWQVNRRVQRGFASGAAAVATALWISTATLAQPGAASTGPTAPPIILAVLGAILWGVLCLVVTPPYVAPDEDDRGPAS
ncbi:DUF1648 domain-containing protein [Plantibacter flavus]|uniref:DUF1648 domain-containing protein n=1 Tax=Plantibacter flavus TaxID=150123 RepID=UPI003F1567AA